MITSPLSVDGGSWQEEISWDLACSDGTVLSGGAPYHDTVSVELGARCSLKMRDSYGDGWNGNLWTGLGKSLTVK
jgi:hypothetical protein